jgi:hypothetical protein
MHFLRSASVVLDTSEELTPIAYVMEAETKDAIAALNRACELRFMREGPHGEISFVHSLMQREVYAEMGANQRRYLHARAAEWFERNGSMAPAAFHFEQAGQFDHMVRAGYQAAAQAEHAGMYHTALVLYQKLRPHVGIEELGPRLAEVLIVLGDWDEAARLIELLPAQNSRVGLLRSELEFVRGNFEAAQGEAEMALVFSVSRTLRPTRSTLRATIPSYGPISPRSHGPNAGRVSGFVAPETSQSSAHAMMWPSTSAAAPTIALP